MPEIAVGDPTRVELEIDVSGACPVGGRLTVAASLFLPPAYALVDGATVVFALSGGGYSRGYYDMHFPGHGGYSQAEHHVARGLVLVAIDHLGVGASTPRVCDQLRVEDIAAANHAAVQKIAVMLETGTAAAGYPPIRVDRKVGVGQSMGGAVTIIMSARHDTYDAIAVLGFSAIHTVLPFPEEGTTAVVADQVGTERRDATPEKQSVARTAGHIPDFLYPFHWSDVPVDIVDADVGGGYPFRTDPPTFGSATVPNCAVAMLSPGYLADDAAVVQVPVFVGAGERDTLPSPLMEPSAYEKATDVTVFVCPQMAHMHNFASTRMQLWDRLVGWCAALS